MTAPDGLIDLQAFHVEPEQIRVYSQVNNN